jgi:hypothetical protein
VKPAIANGRLEVALASGREKGVEDLALGVEGGVGDNHAALDGLSRRPMGE